MKTDKMAEKMRDTGIDILGDASWGTHFCLFYQTKEDLIDILVPYFKAGLENNEFCLWITSGPLSVKEAQKAMKRAVPNFGRYLKRGRIEIVPYTKWYLQDGRFNPENVFDTWTAKLNQALAKGYDGVRVTGDLSWLEKKDWRRFADLEEKGNRGIGKYPVIALCTYPLDKCGTAEVIDVISNHGFALIKRKGKWEVIESSERKEVKKVLRESEERFRDLAELLPEIVYEMDTTGRLTFANQAAFDTFGYSQGEFDKGLNCLQMLVPEDRGRGKDNIRRILSGEKVGGNEYTALRKDGSTFPVIIHSTPIIRENKPVGLRGVIVDITKLKQAEEELKKAKASVEQKVKEATRQLKKQHRAQQNFFIDLAHELKTPLTVMKGNLGLALGKAKERTRRNPKNFSNFLTAQKEEVERIGKVINDLSILAKAETNQITLRLSKVRLDKLIEKLCLRLQTIAKKEKKKLSVKKLMPLTVMADRERLEQLIGNLLDNAIKFTKSGSGKIQVSLTADRGKVLIRIKDNGIGIPKKELPYIFKRRYRCTNVKRRREFKGSGFGLPICQWIVKEHGGKIMVKSRKGIGTEFLVLLP